MDGNGLLGLLGGGALTAFLGILWFVLRRTDRALERSNSAISATNRNLAYTGQNMALVEALRQAIYLQGNSLDQWEDWGVDVQRQNRALQRELKEHGVIAQIRDLPPPPTHLDLTPLFNKLPHSNSQEPEHVSKEKAMEDAWFDRFMKPAGHNSDD